MQAKEQEQADTDLVQCRARSQDDREDLGGDVGGQQGVHLSSEWWRI